MADKKITDLTLRSNVNDDVNFPIDDGVQTYRVTGPQVKNYMRASQNSPIDILNYSLSASVGSSALTIALKDSLGNNPGSANPVSIAFRSTTMTDGKPVFESVIAALSTVISSGSKAGHADGVPGELHIYALNNGGTIELAWSGSKIWNEDILQSTTAEGGAGAADDGQTLYSTTARTNKAIRYLGRFISTQTTAGTWAAVPVQIDSTKAAGVFVPQFAQCYFDGSNTWYSPGSMGDMVASGSGSFFVKVDRGIFPVAEGSGLPGISFTPDSLTAAYEIEAILSQHTEHGATSGPTEGDQTFQLTDGSGNLISEPFIKSDQAATAGFYVGNYTPMVLKGIFEPKSISLQTVKIQGLVGGSGRANVPGIGGSGGAEVSLTFIIKRIA